MMENVYENIEKICQRREIIFFTEKAVVVYQKMKENPELTEMCVVDQGLHTKGILTRSYVLEKFGGQYGFNLQRKHAVEELMQTNFLVVDCRESVEKVAKLAMERPVAHIYDAIVITKNRKYYGVVTVRDLLLAAINIQIRNATDANPLTGLPGNSIIQQVISDLISSRMPFSIAYLDLDNFKAYNDVYGFSRGDEMIKLLAECIRRNCRKDDFIGHIGGDDFVIAVKNHDPGNDCRKILDEFQQKIRTLYSAEDWDRGYIISKNRKDETEQFPLATVSIAAVTNRVKKYETMEQFSRSIAQVKKISKQTEGNSLVIL